MTTKQKIGELVPGAEYAVGDKVIYRENPENSWHILGFRVPAITSQIDPPGTIYVFAHQDGTGTKQWFPSGVFTKVETKAKKVAATPKEPKAKKKQNSSDPVAKLLGDAESIEGCWQIAGLAGLDLIELRAKIGHLGNGLQRMGIGNRLRKLHKDGQFDPGMIIWTDKGFTKEKTK